MQNFLQRKWSKKAQQKNNGMVTAGRSRERKRRKMHAQFTYLSTSSRKVTASSSLRFVTSMEYNFLTMVRKLVQTVCNALVSCSCSWVICRRSMQESQVHMVPLASKGSPAVGNMLKSPSIPREGSKPMSCSRGRHRFSGSWTLFPILER